MAIQTQRQLAINQTRMPELGRFRMGEKRIMKRKDKKGQEYEVTAPTTLETWRITSPSRDRLLAAVELGWGEEVTPWDSPHGQQWELRTSLSEIEVVVPPWASFSRSYEAWNSRNMLVRRCDGERITHAGIEDDIGQSCICMVEECPLKDAERCALVSRLNLIVPELRGIGLWRFETHGINTSIEMAEVVPILEDMSRRQMFVACVLSIVPRSSRNRESGQLHRFKVATIQPKTATLLELLSGQVPDSALAIPAPKAPEPKQVMAAMADLGYGDELPATHYHQLPEGIPGPATPNPYPVADDVIGRGVTIETDYDRTTKKSAFERLVERIGETAVETLRYAIYQSERSEPRDKSLDWLWFHCRDEILDNGAEVRNTDDLAAWEKWVEGQRNRMEGMRVSADAEVSEEQKEQLVLDN